MKRENIWDQIFKKCASRTIKKHIALLFHSQIRSLNFKVFSNKIVYYFAKASINVMLEGFF